MNNQRELIRHILATLAYRTQKAIRGADNTFPNFYAGNGTRTPIQLIRHMSSVIGYARTFFIGGIFHAETLSSFSEELERFHTLIADLSAHLAAGTKIRNISLYQLLQGPISDAMTHSGQLSLLRRLAGSPIDSENFIFAEISAEKLGSDQPLPAAPDFIWLSKLMQYAWRFNKFLNKYIKK